jgi:lipopolysaccharide biosynthesis protein
LRISERRRGLVVGYGPPARDRDGGSQRQLDLTRFLVEDGWSATFATATRLRDPHGVRELQRAGVRVHDGTAAEFETVLREGAYELAICSPWQVAELYLAMIRRVSPETAVIVDCPRLQLVDGAHRILHAAGDAGPAHHLGPEDGSEMTGELNVYATADRVLAASAADASLVNTLLGDDELASWVPDAEQVAVAETPFRQRKGIVVPGIVTDQSYADAAEYLCTEIVPLIGEELLSRHPISIVSEGRKRSTTDPPQQHRHVLVLGGVPSLAPFLERARLTALPLRSGAGPRRELIDSLLAGTPAVATSVATRRAGLRHGEHVLVADDPWSFAEAIGQVVEDEATWQRLARGLRARRKSVHGRDAVRTRFLRALDGAQARTAKRLPPVEGSRERFELRLRRQRNGELLPAIRQVVRASIPPEARVLVVTEGSDGLLRLGRGRTCHFPRGATDTEARARPSDSEEAIALLEQEVRAGAEFLLIPGTASGWLSSYPGFADYLRSRFSLVDEGPCTLVQLRPLESNMLPARLIAFYLPQFHPIPENDEWWGKGFTEWSNVARARPLFADHYQPHVPAELGFYDLRLAEARDAQARLAAEAGIHAFCYYHYWFHGQRLLERPFDEVLAAGRPDFPFCLCWANEPWSRRWDGSQDDVLQAQAYSPEDDLEHIKWLLPALRDPRALTVDGRPVFLVYDAKALPDAARTADLWRHEVRKAGLPGLDLIAVETDRDRGWDATLVGFDAKVRFQPQFSVLQTLPERPVEAVEGLRVWDYEEAWRGLMKADPVAYRQYETVCTGWDNSPRRNERGWVLHNSSPEAYGRWLAEAIARAQEYPPEQRLVFVNAWNEWAEGAHLEPDRRHGHGYLDATRAALQRGGRPERAPDPPGQAGGAIGPKITLAADGASEGELAAEPRARAIAFYLPQFHPTPENDEWWGPGFTEWTNVVQAGPLFDGHHQPHMPSHLGLYDLRVPEVREAQAELARAHGIEAFCYWHYWFAGRQLLHRPFEDVLSSGEPDFPFCLAWANESWSRSWLGESRDLLIEQRYSAKDDHDHARWLLTAFADRRYLCVRGRPLFLIYRPKDLPDPRRTSDTLRSESTRAGLPEPFLLGVNAWEDADYRALRFDGTVNFEPQLAALGDQTGEGLKTYDYAEARARMRAVADPAAYPTIVVSWDNTPRRGLAGTVLTGATPAAFEQGLREIVESTLTKPPADRLVFINAWNEWAEGNHLEPDEKHGLGHLEAVRRVIAAAPHQSIPGMRVSV